MQHHLVRTHKKIQPVPQLFKDKNYMEVYGNSFISPVPEHTHTSQLEDTTTYNRGNDISSSSECFWLGIILPAVEVKYYPYSFMI